jgi:nicotinamide riboside transporter PnuC
MIGWIITAVSLVGAILNAKGKIWGFYIWIPANIGWVVYDFCIGNPSQATLFILYTAITGWGIYQWKKKGMK